MNDKQTFAEKHPRILSKDDLEAFFYQNLRDIEYNTNYTRCANEGKIIPRNLIETIFAYSNDRYVEGFVIQYPHGTVIQQGMRTNFFRGEAEDYPTSKTTLHRELDKCVNEDQRTIIQVIARMRIVVFRNFLQRLKYVRQWKEAYGDPFYDAIAQHYGFMTDYLDITNDFNVAMFFACCVWDVTKKKWRSMTAEECSEKKYGVLYQARSENVQLAFDDYDKMFPAIIPVGYQPFYRCQKQVGYVKHMKHNEDFKDYSWFNRYYFEHSTVLSEGVFRYMNGGLDIYPEETLAVFNNEIEYMKSMRVFSESTFDMATAELQLSDKREELLDMLNRSDFSVGSHSYKNIEVMAGVQEMKIPRQKINRFNLKNERRSPERDNNINLSTRWIYRG